MPLPVPHPGLVIGYRYLWYAEAQSGRVEGRKDRPCVVVLAVQEENGETVVTVAPVTHSPPRRPADAVEIPQRTKQRLGLDEEQSWIIVSEVNRFVWPGPDLRPVSQQQSDLFDYGVLPPRLFDEVRHRLLSLARARRAVAVKRTK